MQDYTNPHGTGLSGQPQSAAPNDPRIAPQQAHPHQHPVQPTPQAAHHGQNYAQAQPQTHAQTAPPHGTAQPVYGQHQSPHGYAGYTAPEAQFFYDADDGAAAMPKLGVTQWAGAAVSLSLVLMIGVWGYKQMVRDVSGVPVIRALEGVARAVPDDPGGQLAMHQGLAVNSVTADGSAAAPADRLMLAPRPTALLAEDQPMSAMAPEETVVAYAPATNAYAQDPNLQQVAVRTDPLQLEDIEATSAPVEPSDMDMDIDVDPAADLAAGVITKSPLPRLRPVRSAPTPVVAEVEVASATPEAAIATLPSLDGVAGDILAAVGAADEAVATDIPVDAAMVQLGAFPEAEKARTEWDRLSTKFSEQMTGKQRVIVEASSGGKTFYRLRAIGFADVSESLGFCAELDALNTPCVPVPSR